MQRFPHSRWILAGSFLLLVLQVLVFTPFVLLAANQEEFTLGIDEILGTFLWPVAVAFVLSVLAAGALPQRAVHRTAAFLLFVLVVVYVQGNFLLWNYGPLDGREISWELYPERLWIEAGMWFSGLLAVFYLNAALVQNGMRILLLVLALQSFSIFHVLLSNSMPLRWRSQHHSIDAHADEQLYSLSSQGNVVVVLLDGFASPALQTVIADHPEYAQRLKGFTFFPDTLGSFPTTAASIPAVLSGEIYANDRPLSQFIESAISRNALPKVLRSNGYATQLVTLSSFCRAFGTDECRSILSSRFKAREDLARFEAARLLDLSLFRHVPQIFKPFIYNNQKWFFQRIILGSDGDPLQLSSLRFVDDFASRARADSSTPTFKFFHIMLPHLPLRFDSDCRHSEGDSMEDVDSYLEQSRCALSLAMRIIDTLKALNVFDQSLVVVLSDHGASFEFQQLKPLDKFSQRMLALPVLLIKPPGHQDEFTHSPVAAALADLPKTVTSLLGLDAGFPGVALFDGFPSSNRPREFYSYSWESDSWPAAQLPPMTRFVVRGNAWEATSWSAAPDADSNLTGK